MAIQSFADPNLREYFETGKLEKKKVRWLQVKKLVLRKLDLLHYAHELHDLRSPPGNHLEALKGDLKGFHSIRVNDQWRLVFSWGCHGPEEVSVVDYHR